MYMYYSTCMCYTYSVRYEYLHVHVSLIVLSFPDQVNMTIIILTKKMRTQILINDHSTNSSHLLINTTIDIVSVIIITQTTRRTETEERLQQTQRNEGEN